ncbi:MAG TPA: lipase maturation factor family protein [Terriglobales bacterium]|nr:lipase maturation factor family protein [Terriglobales bacterium]
MDWKRALCWLFDYNHGASNRLVPRWLFLRALGLIYFSAFYSLIFQIRGLIGPDGILPANSYLEAVARAFGHFSRYWYAPTLVWFSASSHFLVALCGIGMAASVLLVLNLWPRGMLLIALLCFLSFVSAAQDFSSYQSDGMLLEAGFISLFFAPPGFRPGLAETHSPSRASLFLLIWEWFRIYFESGVVKIVSGDQEWRHLTAMDEYYQNGPLPTWIGWYAQHLPHRFHAATAFATLALELGLVWLVFMPRFWRIALFFIVTLWQIPVILTANYTFLNYLVLVLGVLILDDRFLVHIKFPFSYFRLGHAAPDTALPPPPSNPSRSSATAEPQGVIEQPAAQHLYSRLKLIASALVLTWVFYATTAELVWIFGRVPLPTSPVIALEPFRIANQYGLFAVMTRGRYEIEFQGSDDGHNWIAYPFRYKPQALNVPPGIYAPYQPRFDWNLWFASLGSWREYSIVPNTEVRLLENDKDVLSLFAGDPFPNAPPRQVRAVLWQYWFTSLEQKRATGDWWRREFLGVYAPTLEREPDGRIVMIELPNVAPRR